MSSDTCQSVALPGVPDSDTEKSQRARRRSAAPAVEALKRLVGTTVEDVLMHPSRVTVHHSFSLHNMNVTNEGVKLHIVLKFRYNYDIIAPIFGVPAPPPETSNIKQYSSAHRLFPFCIFNSIDEQNLSWTYTKSKSGECKERVEMLITLTVVDYIRYFPFELKLLPIKVGTDGTAKTGLVNLLPEVDKSGAPNVDFGVFTKDTSQLCISDVESDVVCKMVIRDLTTQALGNMSGIYTRVYTVFFFESMYWENLLKFVFLSTILLNVTVMFVNMANTSMVSSMLAIVFAQLALLFILPGSELTTAGTVVTAHTMYVLIVSFVLWILHEKDIEVSILAAFVCNMVATTITGVWLARERHYYNRLKRAIKEEFNSGHPTVAQYGRIDRKI